MTKILYIGSGKSAVHALNECYNDCIKVAVNNAWRLFENTNVHTWIHSGDFPRENYPLNTKYFQEVSYKEYSKSAEKASEILKWNTKSPQHYAGYTIFFMGLYYIMMEMKPSKIGLLGFDHDYNPLKVNKWNSDNRPNIQNQFNNKSENTIEEWSNNYFKDMETDFFYGHGTPDPLRLGGDLKNKFELAMESSHTLGINIVNCSTVRNEIINPIPHGKL